MGPALRLYPRCLFRRIAFADAGPSDHNEVKLND